MKVCVCNKAHFRAAYVKTYCLSFHGVFNTQLDRTAMAGLQQKKNWFYQFVVRMSREKMRQINMMQERQNPQLPNLLIDIKKKEKIVQ